MDDFFDNKNQDEQKESEPPSSNEDISFGFPSATSSPPLVDVEDSDEEDIEGAGVISNREPSTPHDDIKVSVKSYQVTADDFIFEAEVEVNGQTKTVQRNYKDLQWLHRNLSQRLELGGYILPPLPAPPLKTADPKLVLLGESPHTLFGDSKRLACIEVEQFMQALADHKFFSENDTVHTYVANDQISERDKLGTGTLWNALTGMISDFQLGKLEEPDEDFHRFLQYVTDLAPLLRECALNHSKMVNTQMALACSHMVIAEILKEQSTFETFRNKPCSSLSQRMSEASEEEKLYLYSQSLDGRHTVGINFDLYHRYCLQAKEMLYRRLSKLQKLLTCTNKLDKAKPEKKHQAEDAREAAEKDLQSITETARKEIALFKQKYVDFFHGSMIHYAESQLAHSRRAFESMAAIRDQLLNVN